MDDDYAVLGLTPEATPAEVRAAYRRLAKRYHPDTKPPNPKEASLKFAQITIAYDRIKDQKPSTPRRSAPPRTAPIPSPAAAPRPSPPPRRDWADSGPSVRRPGWVAAPPPAPPRPASPPPRRKTRAPLDPNVPFDWAGWGGKEGAHAALGESFAAGTPFVAIKVDRQEAAGDVSSQLEISVRESLLGAVKRVVLLDEESCRGCQGTGKVPPRKLPCAACGGTGRREETHLQGAWRSIDRCQLCKGSGSVERDECDLCGGKGKEARHDIVMVEVPPGSPPGRRIRIAGMGRWDAARKQRGDYYLAVSLVEGPESWIEHGARHMAFPVPRSLLQQGGKLVVPTPEGPQVVPIASHTADGDQIRVEGAGPKVAPKMERAPLFLHLREVEDPGDISRSAIGIPSFLRKAVPTEPGESVEAAWSACLDTPDHRGFFIVTSRKMVFLSKENLEGVGMEWFSPLTTLELAPIQVPPDTPRDRVADWAITVAGRKVYLRRTLAQIEKIFELLEELKAEQAWSHAG